MNDENAMIGKEYFNILKDVKETIRQSQNKAMVYVNSTMILNYYKIGTIINKKKSWGNKFIQRLSEDLKEYGRGYSYEQLKRMSHFASEFSDEEIRSQPVTQIPWGTLITVILAKSKSHKEMLYHINEAYKHGWSRSMVLNQIELKSYERSLIEPDTSESVKSDDSMNELFKDTYVFDFIDREKIKSEKDLKNELIDHIIEFLNELGPGFALVGKEYKLVTPTNEEFFIDLLMYHTKLHCYVVIEVKIGKFSPSDLGQLIFYVNAIDDLERTEKDEETIGLLLCKDADEYTAKTSLNKSLMKLGISKYKFLKELPEYLEKKLKEDKS